MEKVALFSYVRGNSVFHRMNGSIKLLFLCAGPPLIFLLPPFAFPVLFVFFTVLFACTSLPLTYHLKDLRPILSYGLILYFADAVTGLQAGTSFWIPQTSTVILMSRLIISIQLTSIFFRTTSSSALTTSLSSIEKKITGNIKITPVFSLFLSFIPLVFSVWNTVRFAWKSRGGKSGIKQTIVLLPVVISICMHKAHTVSLAVKNRTEY